MSSTRQNAIETLRDMIKGIDMAMLTTVHEDGTLRSRPMSTQEFEFDGELWFFTYDNTGKTNDIAHEQQVNVSYMDKGKDQYISVSGTGSVRHDRQKMEALWSPILKAWFPEGLETPNLALLCVDVQKAEYWVSDGKVAALLDLAKSLLTGTEAEGGKNEKLTLR
ncbi:MAG: pyridoxamine 5'-phosphate oxidase family protein [Chloroflexota bacterium]|nr:pyridoxamine 5'-phosphate oxidase family protein [Chloroflexota bacterium]